MPTSAIAEIIAQAPAATTAGPMLIRRAAVLGAGTMGSRIAAHLANCGIPVLLLDIVPEGEKSRNKLATSAIEALLKAKPAAFYEPSQARLVTPGNFEDHLPSLATCDWILEAVTENLAIKHDLLIRVLPYLNASAILTTNTSGLPIGQIASSLGDALTPNARKRWFGTHFFNPPRYMRLLEIIPTADSDPEIVAAFSAFADRILGKQVVAAHDSPNFIANRIGVANMNAAVNLAIEQDLTVEEVDALTGTFLGWPRTGTFRLADMVGIDILAHVAANFQESAQDNQDNQVNPAQKLIEALVENKWLGDKSRQGFYKKSHNAAGEEERLALDLKTLEYRASIKAKIPSIEIARNAASLPDRLRMLLANDPRKDKAAAYLWPLLTNLWNYAADRIGEVAADAPAIDRAMCAGFNWELGPFALWDAAGVPSTVARMREFGRPVSANVEKLLAAGFTSWYSYNGSQCFSPISGQMQLIAKTPGHARIADFRASAQTSKGVVKKNSGASLVDLGDGIGCIELHSPKSAIGGDVVSLLRSVLNETSDNVRGFRGFVLSSDQENFSVGANLMQLLLSVQEGAWDEINQAIRNFQQMTAAIKFCPRPVVVAPYGLCLGGGAEMTLHAQARQPFAELYMGLVEAGVGLIPGGGGTKEMALRAHDLAIAIAPPEPRDPPSKLAQSAEYSATLKRALETIAMAKVSTSAMEAANLGLLSRSDQFTCNRERLLLDAKAQAILLADQGYIAPVPRAQFPVAGLAALPMLEAGIFLMGEAGFASEHDQKVAGKAAHVLCGGRVTPGTLVSEQYLLDLEREAFLSLCGERKTMERITYTLKTGKPLRN